MRICLRATYLVGHFPSQALRMFNYRQISVLLSGKCPRRTMGIVGGAGQPPMSCRLVDNDHCSFPSSVSSSSSVDGESIRNNFLYYSIWETKSLNVDFLVYEAPKLAQELLNLLQQQWKALGVTQPFDLCVCFNHVLLRLAHVLLSSNSPECFTRPRLPLRHLFRRTTGMQLIFGSGKRSGCQMALGERALD